MKIIYEKIMLVILVAAVFSVWNFLYSTSIRSAPLVVGDYIRENVSYCYLSVGERAGFMTRTLNLSLTFDRTDCEILEMNCKLVDVDGMDCHWFSNRQECVCRSVN